MFPINLLRKKNMKSTVLQQQLRSKVADAVSRIQLRCAHWLNAWTSKWTVCQKKVFLTLLVAVLGSYSTMTAIRVFTGTATGPPLVRSETVMPVRARPSLKVTAPAPFSFETERDIVRTLRRRLDSLASDPSTRAEYEEFVRNRPGWLDSLAALERIYQSEQEK